jgi:hypothetical protein
MPTRMPVRAPLTPCTAAERMKRTLSRSMIVGIPFGDRCTRAASMRSTNYVQFTASRFKNLEILGYLQRLSTSHD